MNCATADPAERLDCHEVQRAVERMEVLRLLWRSVFGLYVLEDQALAQAMRKAGLLDVVQRVSGRKLTLVA